MNLTATIKNLFRKTPTKDSEEIETRNRKSSGLSPIGALMFGGSSNYTKEGAMKLSAVYAAVTMISNSIAALPLEILKVNAKGFKTKFTKHPTYHLLNCEPNQRMSRHTWIKVMVSSVLLKGNAYSWIERDEQGNIKGIHYLPSEYVTIVPPSLLTEPVTYSVVGFKEPIKHTDMIHVLNYSDNGVYGVSTISYAARSLGIAQDAEEQAGGWFRGGCNMSGILTVSGSLDDETAESISRNFKRAFTARQGGDSAGIAVVEAGMSYTPVMVNSKDAELLESRAFSVVEIARWFTISPTKLFDYSKSSYATLEATNLSYLSDTLQPIIDKFEQELERKLFPQSEHPNIEVKFDTTALLKSDKQSLANYYSSLFNIGVLTPNEIRKELNMTQAEGGDNNFVQVNIQTLKRATSETPADSQDIKEALNDAQPTE